MKDSKMQYFFLFLAIAIKFALTLILRNPLTALLYSIVIGFFGVCLFKYKMKIYNYVMLLMIDFLIGFMFCESLIGINILSITYAIMYFSLSGVFFYYLLFENLTDKTSLKNIKNSSNKQIDKGLNALEKDDYKEALECFSKAIKESKTNYLGYMGMCNTLTKIEKTNIKKIKYYKRKCIKYAPKELKESINNKY